MLGKPLQQPYLIKHKTVQVRWRCYNPNYGDDHICKCGHPYYRHFDSWEEMAAVGCKWCDCLVFYKDKLAG